MAKKSKRGFASMDPKKQRQIASLGGLAAQKRGKAHHFDHEQAVAAGRKGGQAAQASGNACRFDSRTGRAAARKRPRRS